MKDEKSFRLMIGLLAAAWIVVGIAVAVGLGQAGLAAAPLGLATLAGIAIGAVGLLGTWKFRKWGPPLFLAANLVMLVKPWLFGAEDGAQGGINWGYGLTLLLYAALVAANWNRFRD